MSLYHPKTNHGNNVYLNELSVGPFRATQLWHNIISYLQTHVDVGSRRRHLVKQHDVFTGSNAVDVVFDFLKQSESYLKREVNRENAVKVCQTMLDNQIFLPVSGKPSNNLQFRDSSLHLYKFSNVQETTTPKSVQMLVRDTPNKRSRPPSLRNREDSRHSKSLPTSDAIIYNLNGDARHILLEHSCVNCHNGSLRIPQATETEQSFQSLPSYRVQPPDVSHQPPAEESQSTQPSWSKLRRTLSFLRHNKDRGEGTVSASTSYPLQGSSNTFSRSIRGSVRLHPASYVHSNSERDNQASLDGSPNQKLQELALSHLLVELDIPFLESILEIPDDLPEISLDENGIVIQNRAPLSELQNIEYDDQRKVAKIPWVEGAMRCINSLPLGLAHLWSIKECKIHCYQTVLEYYQQFKVALFPEAYFPVCTAVIKSVRGGKIHKALRILQLLLFIMPHRRKDQLKKLLVFLNIVIRDLFVNINKKVSNNEVVLRDFSFLVFGHPLMSFDCSSMFLDFLLNHTPEIFTMPHHLICTIKTGITFCEQVSAEEYHRCCQVTTYRELQQLLIRIVESPSLPTRRKKYLLKKFQQLYPSIYASCM